MEAKPRVDGGQRALSEPAYANRLPNDCIDSSLRTAPCARDGWWRGPHGGRGSFASIAAAGGAPAAAFAGIALAVLSSAAAGQNAAPLPVCSTPDQRMYQCVVELYQSRDKKEKVDWKVCGCPGAGAGGKTLHAAKVCDSARMYVLSLESERRKDRQRKFPECRL